MSLIRVMTRDGRSVVIPSCDIGGRMPPDHRLAAEQWAAAWTRFDEAMGVIQSVPPAAADALY